MEGIQFVDAHQEEPDRDIPPPTSILYRPRGLAARPGACSIIVRESKKPTEVGTMMNHAVVIAGGGPTGLMLAGELALARVDVAIVERRENQDLAGLRASGLHIRTIEVFDQRGIVDRFVSQGQVLRRAPFAGITLDISDLPTRHSYFLALWQTRIERILTEWVGELGVPVYRKHELTGFAQSDTSVDVELSDNRSLRAISSRV